jgi:hypothetical protein
MVLEDARCLLAILEAEPGQLLFGVRFYILLSDVVRLKHTAFEPPVPLHFLDCLDVESGAAIKFELASRGGEAATRHHTLLEMDTRRFILRVVVQIFWMERHILFVVCQRFQKLVAGMPLHQLGQPFPVNRGRAGLLTALDYLQMLFAK